MYICGFRKHKTSMNQRLTDNEIKKKLSYCERISLWWFFHTYP